MYTVQSPEELPSLEDVTALSGLEYMQSILEDRMPGPAICALMGFHLHSVRPGTVTFHGTPTFSVTNPMGTVHGGWYGTLLDSAMACSVMTQVPQGAIYTTLEFKINIIRPIPLGTEVACTGTVEHTGRSTGVARAELRGVSDDRLYATGSTTCIVMQIRPAT